MQVPPGPWKIPYRGWVPVRLEFGPVGWVRSGTILGMEPPEAGYQSDQKPEGGSTGRVHVRKNLAPVLIKLRLTQKGPLSGSNQHEI